jgi:hypothetical protein
MIQGRRRNLTENGALKDALADLIYGLFGVV